MRKCKLDPMADYHPLIARAVAGLDKNTGENRRALYERARTALVAQLRGVVPALDESEITRERLALEEAIRKVEAESARQFVDPAKAPPPKPRASEPPQWEEQPRPPRDDAFRAASPPRSPAPSQGSRAPSAFQQPQPRPSQPRRMRRRHRVAPPPPPPSAPSMPGSRQSDRCSISRCRRSRARTPPSRHPLRRPERRSLSDAGLKDFRNVVSEANELGGASARATVRARCRGGPPPPPAPAPDVDRHEPQFDRPSSGCSSSTRCTSGRRTRFPRADAGAVVHGRRNAPAPPKARRAPPPSRGRGGGARARRGAAAPLLWRHHPRGRGVR